MKFEINYTCTLNRSFIVDDADSESEARAKFKAELECGDVDFYQFDVLDSSLEVYEI